MKDERMHNRAGYGNISDLAIHPDKAELKAQRLISN